MRILAIDTATENCSAALLLGERLLHREQRLERGAAEIILPMVAELLREADVTLSMLSAIAFGRGPGAFTGVRLAASVTQGLAFGAGLKVVPISDLQALAQRVLDDAPGIGRVLVCNDARMQELYWGCFERTAEGFARASGEEHVSRPGEVRLPAPWSSASCALPGGPAGAGSGFTVYPRLREELGLEVVLEGLLPRAAEVARLAAGEVEAGRILPAEQALPVYLRDDVTRAPPGTS
ncbi:MAG TPA: tRNA (adenosine(37)-N6)-threonylcarbamoyltransferase complex dimerization subunit type 1 TsaB [Steroidobacteraceae bacterium]|nr:tRNA (adenosine(37)-N6)-threonylcarbamoyltransferase complex dimerization subunit type 1 TsaB [Steroidobacteraceae bacterium]